MTSSEDRTAQARQMEQVRCAFGKHVWADDADAPGDTCECGAWYRWPDRIEQTPEVEP